MASLRLTCQNIISIALINIQLFCSIIPFVHLYNCIYIQGVLKKSEQIGNCFQIGKAAEVMKFLVQIDYFGTYDVE